MPKLRSLVANNTQIDDAMFEILAHSPSLSTLHLSGTRVTGKGFEKLPNLWLSSVMLDDTTVDDAVCEVLAQARELSYLSLRRTRITTDGIRTLSVCPRLNQLNISRSATQPDPDLLNLLRAKTPLRCNVYVDPNETPQKTDQPPS